MDYKLVKGEGVDRNFVLSRVVLKGTGKEPVSEEEFVDPENFWNSFLDPGLEEL
jgi:hypothetical protein